MYKIETTSEVEYQQRVIDEANELGVKIEALNEFMTTSEIYKALTFEEKSRFIKQDVYMKMYFDVLADRISNF